MTEFFGFLKVFVICGSLFFIVMLVLLAMPSSKLRTVGMEIAKWVMCAACVFMIPSPVDVVPDVVPVVGWLDDIGYIVAAIAAARGALAEGRKRKLYEQLEVSDLEAKVVEAGEQRKVVAAASNSDSLSRDGLFEGRAS